MDRLTTFVTGADGFVGRAVCPDLERRGWTVRRAVRCPNPAGSEHAAVVAVGDITRVADWAETLRGVDSIVHLAARVHRPSDNDIAAFRRINTDATMRLAEGAARAGVRRFIYLSTLKVLGDESPEGRPFTEADAPKPRDAYAVSKWEAERGLQSLRGDIEIVVLRPPLVYGPGVGANFLRLMRWIDRGVWLPFAAVRNNRSLLYVGNLTSAIAASLTHPAAAGMTFLVSDLESVSTPELIRRLAASLGTEARCWSVPPASLRLLASAVGYREQAQRLLDSLVLDASLIRSRLSWHAPHGMDEGLNTTAMWFRGASA